MPENIVVRVGGRTTSVPFEEYVLGSVLSEVTPLGESASTVQRIYEVQAVIARTYAVAHLGRHRSEGFDLCDRTHCQLYEPGRIETSRFASAARTAVHQTRGRILWYAGKPAEALFHADCGGSTASADAVWGGPAVPYLLPIRDDIAGAAHRSWKVVMTDAELRTAFNADARSRVGRRLTDIQIGTRDPSGRASRVRITGERSFELRGEDLRAIVNQTLRDHGLQSTKFSVTRTGTTYHFDGQGLGHGVGLCQIGAAARARRGDTLDAILNAYFKDTKLVGR